MIVTLNDIRRCSVDELRSSIVLDRCALHRRQKNPRFHVVISCHRVLLDVHVRRSIDRYAMIHAANDQVMDDFYPHKWESLKLVSQEYALYRPATAALVDVVGYRDVVHRGAGVCRPELDAIRVISIGDVHMKTVEMVPRNRHVGRPPPSHPIILYVVEMVA